MKIGSLFDGSGGFPLAASMCGIKPTWASEVEPYPIAVTRGRFPDMKHLGSVTEVRGGEVEPVDVITFGSPCQDLSVAGKRAGLKHTENGDEETTRSGLFMEAVRIIKEMRKATNGEFPRYAVWENVPGAFSSQKGEDFRVVLEELIRIAEPTAVMPEVPKAGWAYADVYCGDGWSLAYRVLDAQYWGVPQRRRRIYLVADFRGQRAGKILFESEGLRGHSAESGATWQATAGDAPSGSGADDREGKCYGIDHAITTGGNCTAQGSCVYEDIQGTLKASGAHAVCYGISSYASNAMKSSNPHSGIYEADTARTLDLNGGNPACNQGGIAIVEPIAFAQNQRDEVRDLNDKAGALQAEPGMKQQTFVAVPYTLKIRSGCEGGGKGALIQTDKSATLSTLNDQYLFQPILDDQGGSQISVRYDGKSPTLRAEMHGNVPAVMEPVTLEPGIAAREGGHIYEGVSGTLRAEAGDNRMAVAYPVPNLLLDDQGGQQVNIRTDDKSPTLRAEAHGNQPAVVFSIENHPADSRVNIDDSGKVQTLTSRMGTGGGNVPMVMESIPIEGNGARPSHQGDGYSESDVMYTLNTIERHAVACAEAITVHGESISGTLMSRDYKGVGRWDSLDKVVCVADHVTPKVDENGVAFTLNARDYKAPLCAAYLASGKDSVGTLMANAGTKLWLGNQEAFSGDYHIIEETEPPAVRYIVRRLTPTECARLQGFPDSWGHPDTKSALTDEEYAFWLNVRNTHAEINGKATKEYTREQMLNWYNKLHTDSAEYKLWGNGIALPCALYVMEGIANEH